MAKDGQSSGCGRLARVASDGVKSEEAARVSSLLQREGGGFRGGRSGGDRCDFGGDGHAGADAL